MLYYIFNTILSKQDDFKLNDTTATIKCKPQVAVKPWLYTACIVNLKIDLLITVIVKDAVVNSYSKRGLKW
jgi:hypothetical protein